MLHQTKAYLNKQLSNVFDMGVPTNIHEHSSLVTTNDFSNNTSPDQFVQKL